MPPGPVDGLVLCDVEVLLGVHPPGALPGQVHPPRVEHVQEQPKRSCAKIGLKTRILKSSQGHQVIKSVR